MILEYLKKKKKEASLKDFWVEVRKKEEGRVKLAEMELAFSYLSEL